MCGLFGFYGARQADPEVLEAAAWLAAKRGPDGWGVLTEFDSRRGLGRMTVADLRDTPIGAYALGHCRLATVLGTGKSLAACQPIRVGRFAVAHNGCVANADELAERFGFVIETGNDSEAIARLLDLLPGSLQERVDAALQLVDHGGHFALAVIDTDDQVLHLSARRIPLWQLVAPEGTYWCSLQPAQGWEPTHGG